MGENEPRDVVAAIGHAGAMKRRAFIYGFAAVALLGAAALGGRAWRHRAQERAAWALAQPARPNLAAWAEAFRARIAAAESRLGAEVPDVAALGELARLYHANGFLAEAERAYRGLLRFDPANGRWPHLLAALLAGYGRLDEAVELGRTAVALAPDYAPARLRLGDVLLKASRSAEAEAAYRDVLARTPDDPYAWLGLARIDLATERLTAAREKLTRAVAADAKFFAGHSLLASVFARLGNDEAAAVARMRASQAGRFREAPDPWLSELHAFCYDAYRLQVAAASAKITGDPRGAVALLERATGIAPDDPRNYRQLGLCWLELREWGRAREEFEKAVALAPQDPANYLDLAQAVGAAGSALDALRVVERGLEHCRDQAGLRHRAGMLLVAMNRGEEALAHLRDAVRQTPEKPDTTCDLVRTLVELGHEREAKQVIEHALTGHPEFPPVLGLAARERIRSGDAAAALALMERAERAGMPLGEMDALRSEFRKRIGGAR